MLANSISLAASQTLSQTLPNPSGESDRDVKETEASSSSKTSQNSAKSFGSKGFLPVDDMTARETLTDFLTLFAGFFVGWKGFRMLKEKDIIKFNSLGLKNTFLNCGIGKKAKLSYDQVASSPEGREAFIQSGLYLPDELPSFEKLVGDFFEKALAGIGGALVIGGTTFLTLKNFLPGKPPPNNDDQDPKVKSHKQEEKINQALEKVEQLALIWGFLELGQEFFGKGIIGQLIGFAGGYAMSDLLIRLQHLVSNKINKAFLPDDYDPKKPSLIGMMANSLALGLTGVLVYLLKITPIKLVKGVASLNSPEIRNVMNAGFGPTTHYSHTIPLLALRGNFQDIANPSEHLQFNPAKSFIQNVESYKDFTDQTLATIDQNASIPAWQKQLRKWAVLGVDRTNRWLIGSPNLSKVMDEAHLESSGDKIRLPINPTTAAITKDYGLKILASIPSIGLSTAFFAFISQLIASPFVFIGNALNQGHKKNEDKSEAS
ncbi:MAG: hypothetical protein SFT81_04010 [Candidatus Caenarcaniphilales bacterium]|nr:hypothetical protein [Candidatus Caenarcaniphilales bacterium]